MWTLVKAGCVLLRALKVHTAFFETASCVKLTVCIFEASMKRVKYRANLAMCAKRLAILGTRAKKSIEVKIEYFL